MKGVSRNSTRANTRLGGSVKSSKQDADQLPRRQYFPRIDNAACLPVADNMISYCDSNDYFCDNGTTPDALTIHETYVQRYGTEAAEYAAGKIGCTAE